MFYKIRSKDRIRQFEFSTSRKLEFENSPKLPKLAKKHFAMKFLLVETVPTTPIVPFIPGFILE